MTRRAEDLLAASERDEKVHSLADLEKAVELAEILASLDDKVLAALRGLAVDVAPRVLDLVVTLGSAALKGLIDRELSKRTK